MWLDRAFSLPVRKHPLGSHAQQLKDIFGPSENSFAWWPWRGGNTRSHSEHGSQEPQRRGYCGSRPWESSTPPGIFSGAPRESIARGSFFFDAARHRGRAARTPGRRGLWPWTRLKPAMTPPFERSPGVAPPWCAAGSRGSALALFRDREAPHSHFSGIARLRTRTFPGSRGSALALFRDREAPHSHFSTRRVQSPALPGVSPGDIRRLKLPAPRRARIKTERAPAQRAPALRPSPPASGAAPLPGCSRDRARAICIRPAC